MLELGYNEILVHRKYRQLESNVNRVLKNLCQKLPCYKEIVLLVINNNTQLVTCHICQ